MAEHKTFPGKVYTVSCAEDTTVVLPDPLGVKEAVVLECTAGQQLHVTATAGRLETSSDQAIVTELFKLAPRLRLTLLQGVAGGWLPTGFTELEYLESSGTQYVDTGIVKSGEYLARFEYAAPPKLINGLMFGWKYYHQSALYEHSFSFFNTAYFGRFVHWTTLSYILPPNFSATGYDGTARNVLETTSKANFVILNGETVQLANLGHIRPTENPLNATIVVLRETSGVKVFSFTIFNEPGLADIELIPVLDDTGTPCMYDKVSKQCFYNKGTGTFGYRIKRTGETVAPMSLRDPYYTAPSGVYARVNGENELDILADTEELSGDGWMWFANTAEAYAHFGIMPEGKKNF